VPLARLATALLDLAIPSACAVCGMPGGALCARCERVMPVPQDVRCERCAHPWPHPTPTCAECPPGVTWARYAMPYDSAVAGIISALKDSRRTGLAEPLARLMVQRIPAPAAGSVLVPIPQSPARRRERGFNQAELIASHLAREWGLPMHGVLTRPDGGRQQRGASRGARLGQVQGAFVAQGRAPHQAVLVDDVLTTGSTITAAARTLRTAGSARLGVVVTARVVLAGMGTRVG